MHEDKLIPASMTLDTGLADTATAVARLVKIFTQIHIFRSILYTILHHLLACIDIICHVTLLLAGNTYTLTSRLTKPSPETMDQVIVLYKEKHAT